MIRPASLEDHVASLREDANSLEDQLMSRILALAIPIALFGWMLWQLAGMIPAV